MNGIKKWKKVLYEDQGVPTNYTDESFLEDMKKNVNTRMYSLPNVVFESGIVSQQLSTICIFVSTFVVLDNKQLDPNILLLIMSTFFILGVFIRYFLFGLSTDLKSFMIVSVFIFGLSPVLKTLMKTISTDTIYAMTTFMFLANMLFHDYGADVAIVSKAISLNTSIFAAVCLASRLPTSWHVYIYVLLAIQLFALFPEFRKNIKAYHRKVYVLLTEVLTLVGVMMLLSISELAAFSLIASHVAITFVFPLWMIKLQQLKNNIHGPWDEAMIRK